LSWLF